MLDPADEDNEYDHEYAAVFKGEIINERESNDEN